MVDNEDIYGTVDAGATSSPTVWTAARDSNNQDQNGCDRGEDVNGDGILQRV